jgi:hypothetical protein
MYLVARNNAEGKLPSASVEQDITLAEIPGFSLKIPAGSATFPPDLDDHTITVTAVNADKIPMPPGEGMQPRFIISIGPPQVKFDPPAPITFPNVNGLKPGEQTHFYSFDHDLGTYVSIGTGTVSEDGATMTSDKGFGIVKGGWHCGGPGNPTGDCLECKMEIVEKDDKFVTIRKPFKVNVAISTKPGNMKWSGPFNVNSSNNNQLTGIFTSIGTKRVTANWTCESGAQATRTVSFKSAFPRITVIAWVEKGVVELPLNASDGLMLALDDPIKRSALLSAWLIGLDLGLITQEDRDYANAFLIGCGSFETSHHAAFL